jgi:hypothetical protein
VETKYIPARPLTGDKRRYEAVEQWVFHIDGEQDPTLVCVEDGRHCIPVVKLREQLNRPANDPLGLFQPQEKK